MRLVRPDRRTAPVPGSPISLSLELRVRRKAPDWSRSYLPRRKAVSHRPSEGMCPPWLAPLSRSLPLALATRRLTIGSSVLAALTAR